MKLGICAVFKNEAPYLKEWIEFHKLVGFDKFLLFNNESSDNWQRELHPYIKEGSVKVENVFGKVQQLNCYHKILKTYTGLDWTAFIDIDEFLYSPNGTEIKKIITKYSFYSCIQANWYLFGTSEHKEKPQGLVIDNYIIRQKHLNEHYKSIVKSGTGYKFINPHTCIVNGEAINPEDLVINHYWTKSEEECKAKFERGRADTGSQREWKEFLKDKEKMSEFEDKTIIKLWSEKLNKQLSGETI